MRTFRIMTFNIRGSFSIEDSVNAWNNRAPLNANMIQLIASRPRLSDMLNLKGA